MSSSDSSTTASGIGLPGALFLTFLILKLCDVIDWSWWWVFAPLWIPAVLVGVILVVFGIFMVAKR